MAIELSARSAPAKHCRVRFLPRAFVYRYGYVPSEGLLARLEPYPERKKIIQPLPPLQPPAEEQARAAATVAARANEEAAGGASKL